MDQMEACLQEEEAIRRHVGQDTTSKVQLSSGRWALGCPFRGSSVNPSSYNFSIDYPLMEPLRGFHFPGTGLLRGAQIGSFTKRETKC